MAEQPSGSLDRRRGLHRTEYGGSHDPRELEPDPAANCNPGNDFRLAVQQRDTNRHRVAHSPCIHGLFNALALCEPGDTCGVCSLNPRYANISRRVRRRCRQPCQRLSRRRWRAGRLIRVAFQGRRFRRPPPLPGIEEPDQWLRAGEASRGRGDDAGTSRRGTGSQERNRAAARTMIRSRL